MPARLSALVVVLLLLAGCAQSASSDPAPSKTSLDAPRLGACRVLTPEDVSRSSNDSPVVGCRHRHTAETFAVGSFPRRLSTGADPDSRELGAFVYKTCARRFADFLGAETSAVMRSLLRWAWFRPSAAAWDAGARWYRCDVIGGDEEAPTLADLPVTAEGVLLGRPEDRWMACVNGPSVGGAPRVPCSAPHTWRAVTTIVVGDAKDPYPGDRMVEVTSRDYCSDSVGAWLNYPVGYDFGYTWFHEAEWKTGNRRSICWARTEQ